MVPTSATCYHDYSIEFTAPGLNNRNKNLQKCQIWTKEIRTSENVKYVSHAKGLATTLMVCHITNSNKIKGQLTIMSTLGHMC